jgi:HTH-type transcriptional regulator/antitoxin HigA
MSVTAGMSLRIEPVTELPKHFVNQSSRRLDQHTVAMSDISTPGQLITALLVKRGWSQRTLARILDVADSRITRVITDKQPVDAALALLLQDVLGAPAEQILNLQINCDLMLARRCRTVSPELSARIRLYGSFPVGEMIKRRWLPAKAVHDTQTVETCLLDLLEIDHAERADDRLNAVECDDDTRKNLVHLAWLCRLKRIAERQATARPYSPSALREALGTLHAKMRIRDAVSAVPGILGNCGIRFAVIEPLRGGELDGGCLWLDESAPVVAVSLRHDRLDHFWLVLRHLLEHILDPGGFHPMLDVNLDRSLSGLDHATSAREAAANEAAHDFCVPAAGLDEFISMTAPFMTERDIVEGATRFGVHPAILVGEISHRLGRQGRFRRTIPKMRAQLAAHAVVDGWGMPRPVAVYGPSIRETRKSIPI